MLQSIENYNLDAIESAIENESPKLVLIQVIAKAINLPKPIVAVAYLKMQKMDDAEIRRLAKLSITIVRAITAGEDIDLILQANDLDSSIKAIVLNYVSKFNTQDQD